MSVLRLIPYEIKKLFSAFYIKAFIILLLLSNILLCFFSVKDIPIDSRFEVLPEMQEYVDKVYALYHENPSFFLSEYERIMSENGYSTQYGEKGYPDKHIFEIVYKVVCADELYHQKLDRLIGRSRLLNDNMESMGIDLHNYTYRYNEQVIGRYGELNETVRLKDTKVYGWGAYFSYNSEVFTVITAITLLVVSLALSDHKSNFSSISAPCRYGRTQTAIAKYAVIIISAFTLTFMFALSSLITVGCKFGYSDIGNAVQAVPGLDLFPLRLNIFGTLLFLWALKALAAVTYGVLLFTLSTLFKSYIFGFGSGIAILALNYYVSTLKEAEMGQWITINLLSLHSPDGFIIRLRTVDLFGYSVDLLAILPLLFLLILTIGLTVCCLKYNINKPRKTLIKSLKKRPSLSLIREAILSHIPEKKKERKLHRHSVSPLFYEFFKQRWIFCSLILLIVIKIILSLNYYTPNSDKDKYYKEYVLKIEGEYTEDKEAYLAEELERINEIISKKEDVEQDFANGVATFEEMKAYYKDYNEAQFYRKPVLSDLIKRADYLKEQYENTGIIGSFMYDTGYVKYAAQGVDWVLLVFLLIFCSRFYLAEHERKSTESPIYTIVQTTGNGRVYLLLKKLLFNMLGVTAVFALFKAIDFICLTRFYDLPGFSYKLFSITRYSTVSADMTILQYTAITLLSSLIGVLLLSLLIFTAALHLKKTLLTYATLCAGIFMPHFIMLTGQKVGNCIDLTRLQDTDRLFLYSINNYSTPVGFLLFFTVILLIVIALMVFSIKRIQKGGKI